MSQRARSRPRGPRSRSFLAVVSFVLAAVALLACREEQRPVAGFVPLPREESGAPRTYQLGYSALPTELTNEAYLAAFDFAANHGEVLLIQRAPSWGDFVPGAIPSRALIDRMKAERDAAAERSLDVMLALDLFEPGARGRLAQLPDAYAGRDLSDEGLRRAFVAEAEFIARNLRPAYLVLGVEVNATYERDAVAYQSFLDAYREAYAVVKAASPETLVFVTFQYEQLLGLVPWESPHAPRWELIEQFPAPLDLLAVTTYPSFVYSLARKIPPGYYTQLREHSSLPIAFASAGYASTPGREGLNSSTAAEQRRYVQRLLTDAEALASPFVVWFAARDPAFAQSPPLDLLANIGLLDVDGQPKEAWPAWDAAVRRPYDAAAASSGPLPATGGPP